MFDSLISALCSHLGLNADTGETDGAFYLQVNDLEIGLLEEPENESLLLQCTVGNIGADPHPDLFAEICEANYYWSATNGATLGLNRATGDVVLVREWALAALDHLKLAALLEKFVMAAEFWQARLNGDLQAGATPAGQPSGQQAAAMLRV